MKIGWTVQLEHILHIKNWKKSLTTSLPIDNVYIWKIRYRLRFSRVISLISDLNFKRSNAMQIGLWIWNHPSRFDPKSNFNFVFFSFSSAQNQMVVVVVFFLLLYVVIFLLYMQIDPFCAQIVLYTLSSNIHGAIPSIHTMNILNIFFHFVLFFPHIGCNTRKH